MNPYFSDNKKAIGYCRNKSWFIQRITLHIYFLKTSPKYTNIWWQEMHTNICNIPSTSIVYLYNTFMTTD